MGEYYGGNGVMGAYAGVTNSWLVQTDSGRTHTSTKLVVQSGLVLNLDAGVSSSYPGSGTTWTDLSGNMNNGSLVNGVGFDSGNGGSLSFDGVDDYVNLASTNSLNLGLGDWTISTWFYLNSSYSSNDTYCIIFDCSQFSIGTLRSGLTGIAGFYTLAPGDTSMFSSSPLSGYASGSFSYSCPGKWTNLAITKNGSTTYCYLNGTLYASKASETYTNQSNAGRIGLGILPIGITPNLYPFGGQIPQIKVYNRALTEAEVQQNFNAYRRRFGI